MFFTDFYVKAVKAIKQNFVRVLLAAVFLYLPFQLFTALGVRGDILLALIGGYLLCSAAQYVLEAVRGNKRNIKDFFAPLSFILPSSILGLILFLVSGVWNIILIVPGFYLLSRFVFSVFMVAGGSKDFDPLEALKNSYAMTKKHTGHIVIAIVVLVLMPVGFIFLLQRLSALILFSGWYTAVAFHFWGFLLLQAMSLLVIVISVLAVMMWLATTAVIYEEIQQDSNLEDYKQYDIE